MRIGVRKICDKMFRVDLTPQPNVVIPEKYSMLSNTTRIHVGGLMEGRRSQYESHCIT